MNKEVELSARLEKPEYAKVKTYLEKHLKKTASQKRFMLRFFKDKVNVRESLDARYKWTDGENTLVIKKGALGSQSREEITVKLGKENQLSEFARIFSLLGYKTGDAIYREIDKYENETIEAALVVGFPYYFLEVESINARSKSQALEHVNEFLTRLGLTPINRSDYQAFQRLFDREVNLIFPLSSFPTPLIKNDYWKKILDSTGFKI